MLRLEHNLLLRHLQEGGGTERGADAEEGQGRVLGLTVLAVQSLEAASDVQSLGWKNTVEGSIFLLGNK